jgi:hypothetical protein
VPLYLGAALAALVAGLFFCWLFLLRPQRLTLRRGAWAGVVSSVVAHPLAWLIALGVLVLTGGTPPWGLPPAPGVLTVLLYAGGYAVYSLILTGWFTALVGGFAGAVAWTSPLARRTVLGSASHHSSASRARVQATAPCVAVSARIWGAWCVGGLRHGASLPDMVSKRYPEPAAMRVPLLANAGSRQRTAPSVRRYAESIPGGNASK